MKHCHLASDKIRAAVHQYVVHEHNLLVTQQYNTKHFEDQADQLLFRLKLVEGLFSIQI
jgi:hypothetical protein